MHLQAPIVTEPQVPPPVVGDGRVDLHAVDAHPTGGSAERPRHRAARVPQDRHALRRPPQQVGTTRNVSQTPPVRTLSGRQRSARRRPRPGRAGARRRARDLDELVARLLLVQHPACAFTAPGGTRSAPPAASDQPAAAEQRRGAAATTAAVAASSAASRSAGSGRARAGTRRAGCPPSRARRDGRPPPPRSRRREREPDRERRHHAEQDDGRREQNEHAEERADRGAGGDAVEPLDGQLEQRPGDERDHGNQAGGGDNDSAERPRLRPPVGEPAAQPVAERRARPGSGR